MLTKHFLLPLILIASDSQASQIVKVSQETVFVDWSKHGR